MADTAVFSGFTKDTVRFFNGLRRNNNREWFAAHREIYDRHVMEPAKAFVVAMGEKLRTAVPGIIAVPLVNKSIFRINRDTRFSLDPSPYKTNLGLYFWEGTKSRMESPGSYFHVEPPDLYLGSGMYMFPDQFVPRYRRAVVDPKLGKELRKILDGLADRKEYELGGTHYKRVPAGYDPGHPNAELLKHNGLWVGYETKTPEEFYSARLVDYCFERYRPLVPLHRWLLKLAG
ncbi:MAG: DUF2461 domain-containing protein [Candidatus Aminicenantales bacterium]|jgi:uncharacterized protein (TIGR02453 family)